MNHFYIKATERARQFFRRPTPGFLTGRGNLNAVEEVTDRAVKFKTTVGRVNRVSKIAIIKAAAFLLERRSVCRKDLERFSRFSSAMFGLLRTLFASIAKIRITKSGLLRLSLKGTRFIFSGMDRVVRDMEIAAANGAEVAMMNYFHLRDKTLKWREHLERTGLKLLLDSGAFTLFQNPDARPIHVDDYISFVKHHRDILIGYFNLDVIGDPVASRANMERMESAGLSPIEVWHVSSPIEELDRIVAKGAAVVGIGGAAKLDDEVRLPYLQEVLRRHPDQDFHFLGVGSKILFGLKGAFSTDATSWFKGRENGRLLTPEGQKPMGHLLDGLEIMARNVRLLASFTLH